MELVFGIAFTVALGAFVVVGLAVGATAEGPDPETLGGNPLKMRITRTALLATAAFLALLGAEASMVAGSLDDPATGRGEALVFLMEGAADLVLALVVLVPAWTLRRVWVLRLVAVCWLVVGPPALVLTFGRGPLSSFYLGFGPDMWAAFAVVVGAVLVWLSSLGRGGDIDAAIDRAASSQAASPRPTHWRGIVTGVALASLVAVSAWPLAQFAGVNALGGCTPGWLVPSNPSFCVTGHLDGGKLTISGQTTLPEGTFVDVQEPGTGLLNDRRVAVKGGRFEVTFDLSGRHNTTITITASVRMDGQQAALVDLYGANGHGLAGPAAIRNGADVGSLLVTLTWDLP